MKIYTKVLVSLTIIFIITQLLFTSVNAAIESCGPHNDEENALKGWGHGHHHGDHDGRDDSWGDYLDGAYCCGMCGDIPGCSCPHISPSDQKLSGPTPYSHCYEIPLQEEPWDHFIHFVHYVCNNRGCSCS
eukprot:gb/GECH01011588.1/.p1 GENE.gb/GECH01011588.1/~~gb/GECH01011588.1/.p1  ORF type:complete len:131 (+),score=23.12 gb/GECH01011588.1/:1-393(+)